MAVQLNYAANSYITVTLEQPNLELASLLKEAPAEISDVGSLGPGDMASTRVLCLNGVPSSDQPALEAKQVSSLTALGAGSHLLRLAQLQEWLSSRPGLSDVTVMTVKKRAKRGGGEF
jgi:hypothetical protein